MELGIEKETREENNYNSCLVETILTETEEFDAQNYAAQQSNSNASMRLEHKAYFNAAVPL